MEKLYKKLMEADEEYGVASPAEMDVVGAVEPLVDKYGVKDLLLSLEAFGDFSDAFHRLIDEDNVWEQDPTEIPRDEI